MTRTMLAALAVVACVPAPDRGMDQARDVTAAGREVRRGLPSDCLLAAVVVPTLAVDLPAPVAGPVEIAGALVGSRVRRDDVLFAIRDVTASDEAERAADDVASALADVAVAERRLARASRVRDEARKLGEFVGGAELREFEDERAVRAAEVDAARVRLRVAHNSDARARRRLARTSVTAPESGRLAGVYLAAGEWAEAGQRVVRWMDDRPAGIRIAVPEPQLDALTVGTRVRWRHDASASDGSAEIIAVAPEVDAVTGLVVAEARFVGVPPDALLAGASLEIVPQGCVGATVRPVESHATARWSRAEPTSG